MADPKRRALQARSAQGCHALLILMPAVLVAGVGAYLLWSDWQLADQQARQRAEGLAGDLSHRITTKLFEVGPPSRQAVDRFRDRKSAPEGSPLLLLRDSGPASLACWVETGGALAYPPPFEPYPSPTPVRWSEVPREVRTGWHQAQMLLRNGSSAEAAAMLRERVTGKPDIPPRLQALTAYRLGGLAKEAQQWQEAWEHWEGITRRLGGMAHRDRASVKRSDTA